MHIRWLTVALADLDAEAAYIANDSPDAAAAVVERIQKAVDRLASFPLLGRKGRIEGTRELVVSRTPYIIPYRVRGDTIEILAVLHGARKWPGTL